ncbi:MAG: hypothetical protein P4N60_12700 [Verrucomicrobiae bacterium]|nr:hypothetical protein [Verrucomicrobiae bacterium]
MSQAKTTPKPAAEMIPMTPEQFQAWLVEQPEDVQSQYGNITSTIKDETKKRKLAPMLKEMETSWAAIQALGNKIKDADETYSFPWSNNPQELYIAICAELDKVKTGMTADELLAALAPKFPEEKDLKTKLETRLKKGTTKDANGKGKIVFTLDAATKKYSRKTATATK